MLHAGSQDVDSEAALRSYLGMATGVGMGLESMTLLEQPEGSDAILPLVEHLAATSPQLVITGALGPSAEKALGFCPMHWRSISVGR